MKNSLILAALAIALSTVSASAANIFLSKNACLPQPCTEVAIQGPILPGDDKMFKALLDGSGVTRAVVSLDSRGGNLLAGLLIGGEIADRGFSTLVPVDTVCSSVCAAIWLAGKEKYATPTSKIGFHGPYSKDKAGNPITSPDSVINYTRKYYQMLGLRDDAISYMMAAAPESMYWFNPNLAKGFGIYVELIK